jgi:Gcd10p family
MTSNSSRNVPGGHRSRRLRGSMTLCIRKLRVSVATGTCRSLKKPFPLVMRISSGKLFLKSLPPTSCRGAQRKYSHINMPEWYPIKEGALQTIQPCKNMIIRLPSENFKVVDLKANSYSSPREKGLLDSSISLGKFGAFNADQLFGKPYGPSWEILPNKDIKLLEREVQEEEGNVPRKSLTDNAR